MVDHTHPDGRGCGENRRANGHSLGRNGDTKPLPSGARRKPRPAPVVARADANDPSEDAQGGGSRQRRSEREQVDSPGRDRGGESGAR